SVSANTGAARNGSVSINGQTFSVSQAAGCTFQINPASQSFPAAGGAGSDIAVTAGTGCQLRGTTTGPWIASESGARTSEGPTRFTIAASTGGARTGTVSVAQQTFTVSQAAGCTFQIAPTSATIAGGAGSGGSVTVTAGAGCTWTAGSNDSWLTISSGASGS